MVVCAAALDVLTTTPGLIDPRFGDTLGGVLELLPLRDQMTIGYAFRRGLLPETGSIEVLAECGALDPASRTVTALGRWARPGLDRPPAPRTGWNEDDVLELRVDLDRFRPPVWRRVRLPAATTLTELHEIIQVLFEWDGDSARSQPARAAWTRPFPACGTAPPTPARRLAGLPGITWEPIGVEIVRGR